ncbi:MULTISPECIES: anti-sigma factor family protein [unclassified Gordonia (in: high G+C Gram-positive bacteria)]
MSTTYRDPPYPDPPYPVDLLADFHAGVLPDDVAAHIRSRLPDDPAARHVLAALDQTQAELRELPVEPIPAPAEVRARTEQTLDAVRAEVDAASSPARRRAASRWGRTPTPVRASVIALAAAAVVAVLAGVLIAVLPRTGDDAAGVQAGATSTPAAGASLDGTERASALTVLGDSSARPFGSESALRRCTAANGVPASTPVLGSGDIVVAGVPRIVILLGTGVAGRFDALVVERGCDTGNPATVSNTTIGG